MSRIKFINFDTYHGIVPKSIDSFVILLVSPDKREQGKSSRASGDGGLITISLLKAKHEDNFHVFQRCSNAVSWVGMV